MTRSAAGSPAFLALACVGFIASAPAVRAAETGPASAEAGVADVTAAEEQEIVVSGEMVGEVESPKATAPLLDTPQIVTVVSDQVIRKQNLLTLRDVLTAIPGITFGAGEGGGGYGDAINLRGYSANNDVTVDGVRDSAQYSRTDPFNLQQIEIYNGANSAFNGSGSVGGTINLVSKMPRAEDLAIVQGSVGTDNYFHFLTDTISQMFLEEHVPALSAARLVLSGFAPAEQARFHFMGQAIERAGIPAARFQPYDGTLMLCT